MNSAAAPRDAGAAPRARLEVLDALRGFALVGVVIANTVAALGFNPFFNPSLVAADQDKVAFRALMILIDGKFLAMYSLLFGVGFGLMASRASSNESGFVHLYLRRAAALFLIGLTNLVLFGGDVLHMYALFAAVLLSLRHASTRTIVVLAVLSLLLPALGRTVVDVLGIERGPGPDLAMVRRLRVDGPYLALIQLRLTTLTRQWWPVLNLTNLLALFFAGLLVARHRVLEESDRHRTLFILVLAVGGLLTAFGIVGEPTLRAWASSTPRPWRYLVSAMANLTTLAQMLAYVAAFMLLWRSAFMRRLLVKLAPSGRLALTNYILVSVIVAIGVSITGAYGSIGPAAGCAIGIAIWVTILIGSDWWIARFRMGPVEWVWRSLAYGKRQMITYLKTAAGLNPAGTTRP